MYVTNPLKIKTSKESNWIPRQENHSLEIKCGGKIISYGTVTVPNQTSNMHNSPFTSFPLPLWPPFHKKVSNNIPGPASRDPVCHGSFNALKIGRTYHIPARVGEIRGTGETSPTFIAFLWILPLKWSRESPKGQWIWGHGFGDCCLFECFKYLDGIFPFLSLSPSYLTITAFFLALVSDTLHRLLRGLGWSSSCVCGIA